MLNLIPYNQELWCTQRRQEGYSRALDQYE